MAYVEIIGLTAGALTTIAFVPQFLKSWKTKLTRDVSLGWVSIVTAGIFLWLVYGILIVSWPLILANVFSFILAFSVLSLKLRYG